MAATSVSTTVSLPRDPGLASFYKEADDFKKKIQKDEPFGVSEATRKEFEKLSDKFVRHIITHETYNSSPEMQDKQRVINLFNEVQKLVGPNPLGYTMKKWYGKVSYGVSWTFIPQIIKGIPTVVNGVYYPVEFLSNHTWITYPISFIGGFNVATAATTGLVYEFKGPLIATATLCALLASRVVYHNAKNAISSYLEDETEEQPAQNPPPSPAQPAAQPIKGPAASQQQPAQSKAPSPSQTAKGPDAAQKATVPAKGPVAVQSPSQPSQTSSAPQTSKQKKSSKSSSPVQVKILTGLFGLGCSTVGWGFRTAWKITSFVGSNIFRGLYWAKNKITRNHPPAAAAHLEPEQPLDASDAASSDQEEDYEPDAAAVDQSSQHRKRPVFYLKEGKDFIPVYEHKSGRVKEKSRISSETSQPKEKQPAPAPKQAEKEDGK